MCIRSDKIKRHKFEAIGLRFSKVEIENQIHSIESHPSRVQIRSLISVMAETESFLIPLLRMYYEICRRR